MYWAFSLVPSLSVTSMRWSLPPTSVAFCTFPLWMAVTTTEVSTSLGPDALVSMLLARSTSRTTRPIHTIGPRRMRLMSMSGADAPSLQSSPARRRTPGRPDGYPPGFRATRRYTGRRVAALPRPSEGPLTRPNASDCPLVPYSGGDLPFRGVFAVQLHNPTEKVHGRGSRFRSRREGRGCRRP